MTSFIGVNGKDVNSCGRWPISIPDVWTGQQSLILTEIVSVSGTRMISFFTSLPGHFREKLSEGALRGTAVAQPGSDRTPGEFMKITHVEPITSNAAYPKKRVVRVTWKIRAMPS